MSLKLTGSSAGSVSVDAPASTTGSADFTLTLPVAVGTATQVLRNSSTPGTLEFGTLASTRICFAARLSAQQTISDDTYTAVLFNSIDYNNGSGYDSSTGKFTVPSGEGGRYLVGWSLRMYDIDNTKLARARMWKNGAFGQQMYRLMDNLYSNAGNTYAYLSRNAIIDLDAGNDIKLMAYSNNGNDTSVDAYFSAFWGMKVED